MSRQAYSWGIAGFLVIGLVAYIAWPVTDKGAPQPPVELVTADEAEVMAAANAPFAGALLALATPANEEDLVCGVKRSKGKVAPDPVDMAMLKILTQRARERLVSLLATQSNEVHQAAGLLIESTAAGDPFASPLGCQGTDCQVTHSTRMQLSEASAAAREKLVRLATSSASDQVYALALAACRGGGMKDQSSACQVLSAHRWAQLDPGNAVPWLAVASDAQVRGDDAGVAEAMFRVSQARISEVKWALLLEDELKRLSDDVLALVKIALMMDLFSIEAVSPLPGYRVAIEHCAPAQLRDPNRHQVCGAIAEVLVTKGTRLADVGIGILIGERVGWLPTRLEAVREERDALAQAMRAVLPLPKSVRSCVAFVQHARYLRDVAHLGEVGAARRLIERSGLSVSQLAEQYRRATTRAAARAASAATGGAPR